jgi:hypothetical protein
LPINHFTSTHQHHSQSKQQQTTMAKEIPLENGIIDPGDEATTKGK